ncbi:MAG TPA: hypothetical protein PLK34_01105 [Candidatus Pacearchaeota archaeon]|nr:hypothetical protein [Candidatus Pacearchaeota archaeon]
MKTEMILIIFLLIIAGLWFFVEVRRSQKRFLVILAVVLIVGTYFGFYTSIQGHDLDLSTFDGVKTAMGLYFSWLGHLAGNIGAITTNAVNMDWTLLNVPEQSPQEINQTKQ